MKNDEIEEVTDEMLEMLVKNHEHVAAIVCKLRSICTGVLAAQIVALRHSA
jgi:hypothetical protein